MCKCANDGICPVTFVHSFFLCARNCIIHARHTFGVKGFIISTIFCFLNYYRVISHALIVCSLLTHSSQFQVEIMQKLQHPRLLQLYDAFDDGLKEFVLILELYAIFFDTTIEN